MMSVYFQVLGLLGTAWYLYGKLIWLYLCRSLFVPRPGNPHLPRLLPKAFRKGGDFGTATESVGGFDFVKKAERG